MNQQKTPEYFSGKLWNIPEEGKEDYIEDRASGEVLGLEHRGGKIFFTNAVCKVSS